jgi:HSP20 family protein
MQLRRTTQRREQLRTGEALLKIGGTPDATTAGGLARLSGKGVTTVTTIVKWSPLRDLDLMERDMRRFFEGFGWTPATVPAADVYETDDEFVVELEVPGYEEKELGIEVSDHVLTVKGEREEVRQETEKSFRLHERLEKQFERRFELPPEVDTAKLTATFRGGVLEVRAMKAKELPPTKVPIAEA